MRNLKRHLKKLLKRNLMMRTSGLMMIYEPLCALDNKKNSKMLIVNFKNVHSLLDRNIDRFPNKNVESSLAKNSSRSLT